MKKQPKSNLNKTKRYTPPTDLTGKRFGKWVVQNMRGKKASTGYGFAVAIAGCKKVCTSLASLKHIPNNVSVVLGIVIEGPLPKI